MYVVQNPHHINRIDELEIECEQLKGLVKQYKALTRFFDAQLSELRLHPYKVHHLKTVPAELASLLETIG